jgi:Ni2+-binding GTPase involved in maturation of urease and hydrogenase
MNSTNKILMGAVMGIAVISASLSFLATFFNLIGTEEGESIGVTVFNLSAPLTNTEFFQFSDFGYLDSLFSALGVSGVIASLLLIIGFMFVVIGCVSPVSRNVKGSSEDPQEYLLTQRPLSIIKALLIPWNIFFTLWDMKKAPVVIAIIFLPFIIPFALIADAYLIVVFLILKIVTTVRIKLAASKDKETYEKLTQYAVCPKCKRNFYQPLVKCKCGLVISYPVPNAYGISTHTCNKGHDIPSTNAEGARSRLQTVCPYCKKDIQTHEARPLAISLVGAVGSGKTTLMLSAVESLSAAAKSKAIVTDITSAGISQAAQRSKNLVSPTLAGELDSECLFMRSRDLPDKEIIINDISGLEFEPDRDKVIFEEYYKYNDGIIFTIDPLAVLAIYNSQAPNKGTKVTPISTLESFYHMFTVVNAFGPSTKSTVPFAVAFTKMDDPRVSSAVKAEGTPENFLIRYGQEAFVKIVKSTFTNVRYFQIASLGDEVNSVVPFKWILADGDPDLKTKLF